mgnify:CR=1 FL=1
MPVGDSGTPTPRNTRTKRSTKNTDAKDNKDDREYFIPNTDDLEQPNQDMLLREEWHTEVLRLLHPPIELLIVGTGRTLLPIPTAVDEWLTTHCIAPERLPQRANLATQRGAPRKLSSGDASARAERLSAGVAHRVSL